jgi:hypothetical protein
MDRISVYNDIPADGLQTPYGRLYRPQSQSRQIIALIAAFLASMSLGSWVAAIPGDLSTAAQAVIHIPYVLVFFFGYGLWVARVNAIVFDAVGRSVLKLLWQVIVHRKPPDARETVLPTREKLIEVLVKVQKGGASFRGISWPIAALSLPVDCCAKARCVGCGSSGCSPLPFLPGVICLAFSVGAVGFHFQRESESGGCAAYSRRPTVGDLKSRANVLLHQL